MAKPRKVVTQPRSIRLTEELDSYVGTLPHGEFTRLVIALCPNFLSRLCGGEYTC